MALSNVYKNFQATRQANEQGEMDDLRKASAVRGMLAQLQQQQSEAAMRAEIDAIPPEQRTRENVLPIVMKYAGNTKDILGALPSEETKLQPIGSGGAFDPRTRQVIPPAARPTPPAEPKPPRTRTRYEGATVIQEEQQADGTWREYGRGGRFAPPAPPAPERPAKLPPPKTGFRYKPDQSGEQEPIPGGPVDIKLKTDKVQSGKSVGLTVQNIDRLDKALEDLNKDPGLPRITGTVFGRAPNLTNEATSAQAKLDSIKSQIFVSALQAMREASKTGGAVGNVTEREGDKLERILAALDQSQGTPQFKLQLSLARQQLRISKDIISRAYRDQYGEDAPVPTIDDPAPPAPPQPAPGAFPDAEKERRYQEWKKAKKK